MTNRHLHILSRTENLNLVRDFIAAEARRFGFDEETTSKITLAVDEACTNIIKHAYELAPTKDIDIDVVTNQRAFEIHITHWGKSFDPDSIKSPDMAKYLATHQRGGLGIHLMRTLMDTVEYRSLPDRRNTVRLVKHLPVNIER